MSKLNLSDNQPKDLNAEDAELGAKVAEESLLCVTLRNPLRPLHLIPSLVTGPPSFDTDSKSAGLVTLRESRLNAAKRRFKPLPSRQYWGLKPVLVALGCFLLVPRGILETRPISR